MMEYGMYITLSYDNNTKDIIKLCEDKTIRLFKDRISHNDIMKLGLNKYIRTANENIIFITLTTLDEYITHTLKIPEPMAFKDASMIINILNIKKNLSRQVEFLEVGTGSGALTICLSDALYTFGWLHTYESNDDYLKLASNNYKEWITFSKMPDNVKFYNEDIREIICPDFFFDGIIIDVPDIDNILSSLYKRTKYGSPIIIFSPNISIIINVIAIIDNYKLPLKKMQLITTSNESWNVRIKEKSTIAKPYPSDHQIGHTGFILHLIHYDNPEVEEKIIYMESY